MFGKPRRKPLAEDSVMPFGKYKGTKISRILEIEPMYLSWLKENTDVEFSVDVEDAIYNAELGIEMDMDYEDNIHYVDYYYGGQDGYF